jgi:hypothetical protein
MRAFPKCPRCGVFHAEIKLKTTHILEVNDSPNGDKRITIGGTTRMEEFTEDTETHCIACDSTFLWKEFRK